MTPDLLITPPEFAQLVPFFQVAPLDSKLQRPGALLSAPSTSGPLGVLGVLGLYLFLKIFLLVASDRSVRSTARVAPELVASDRSVRVAMRSEPRSTFTDLVLDLQALPTQVAPSQSQSASRPTVHVLPLSVVVVCWRNRVLLRS